MATVNVPDAIAAARAARAIEQSLQAAVAASRPVTRQEAAQALQVIKGILNSVLEAALRRKNELATAPSAASCSAADKLAMMMGSASLADGSYKTDAVAAKRARLDLSDLAASLPSSSRPFVRSGWPQAQQKAHQLLRQVLAPGKASCSAVFAHMRSEEKGRLSCCDKAFSVLISAPGAWRELQLSTKAVPHWRTFEPIANEDGYLEYPDYVHINTVFARMCWQVLAQRR
jgi:hypothetical protein